ncbi:MAG: ParB N-terminal domain-containing protein [Armatimonadota bacterium]|nr:ParB N-terminal domain-containing protein [Armatimonadota bacterium]MDR7402540.1 ParB N-terminal domain-containing protein [Armatimonadota bacterium]MDR7403861.1 ParB N-terminal domain-containing protein [Armatimonadota bacterium]MDR7436076.1 ParB N-terminal domain-containing protein [Armatimonadota bacterium]MDR7471955.1 ParB N-terminal domain-containing protein [Armatimonadota bacterium]
MADPTRAHSAVRLPAGAALPDLRIVARDQVHLHEECDPGRVARLVQRLRADGVLRNPPVAAPLPDGGFVVLDGANRTRALAEMGAPAAVLQVVDYQDPQVRLEVWHHLLVEAADLPAQLARRGLPVRPVPADAVARWLGERAAACCVITRAGAYAVTLSPERLLAALLLEVVDTYKGANRIYRVAESDLDVLEREYGAVGALVVFPRFTKEDILQIAGGPAKLPTGITRHLIPGRALRLNLPLAVLTDARDLEAANRWLADEMRRRLLEHRVRYYPEPVFLLDE